MLQDILSPVPDQKLDLIPDYSKKFDFSTVLTSSPSKLNLGINKLDPISNFNSWLNKPSSVETKMQPVTFDWDRLQTDRYVNSPYMKDLGFNPNRDNESRYGYTQTWGNTLNNAFVGMGGLAWNGFKDSWKGWGRMGDALTSWDFSKLAGDNESLAKLNDMSDKIMGDNAIFNTAESEDSFFNRKTMGNFLQQSGFTFGTLAQTVTEQILSKAIEAFIFVPTLGVGSAAIEGVVNAKSAASVGNAFSKLFQTNRIFTQIRAARELQQIEAGTIKAMGLAEKIYKGAINALPLVSDVKEIKNAFQQGASLKTLAGIGLGGIKRGLSEANLALTEARMEAAGTYGSLYSRMYYDYLDRHGEAPSGEDLKSIINSSTKAGQDNFGFNSVLLATMNRIQFDNMFKSFKVGKLLGVDENLAARNILKVTGKSEGKELTQLYQKGLLGTIGQAGEISKTFGKKKALKEVGKSVLNHFEKWELTEGIQEVLQNTSNDYLSDYYYDLYSSKYDSKINPDKDKSLKYAIDNELNMQGFKTFMSGALMGFITSGPSKLVQKGFEKFGSSAEQRASQKKDVETHVQDINGFMRNPATMLSEINKNFKTQADGSVVLNTAINKNDRFAYENMKTTLLGKLVAKSIRMNTHEALLDNLKGLGENMSKEEFEKAFEGLDYTDENKTSAKDYVNKVTKAISSYVDTYKKYHEKFDTKINPDYFKPGSKEHTEALFNKQAVNDAIEMIAGNEFKTKDSYDRMSSIFNKIASNKELGNSLATTFTILGSKQHMISEIALLKQEINSYEDNSTLDVATRKILNSKKHELEVLEQWNDNVNSSFDTDEENEEATKNMFKGFKSYVKIKNEQESNYHTINDSDLSDHFFDMTDYIKLNEKAQQHTDAFNTLINPKIYSKLIKRLEFGAKLATIQIMEENLNNAKPGFIFNHKELVKEIKELSKIEGTPSEEQINKYYELVEELNKSALNYTQTDINEFTKKLQEIIDSKEFIDANRAMIDAFEESKRDIKDAEIKFGKDSDEYIQTRETAKTIYKILQQLAENWLNNIKPKNNEIIKDPVIVINEIDKRIIDIAGSDDNYNKWSNIGDKSDYDAFLAQVNGAIKVIDSIVDKSKISEESLNDYLKNIKAFANQDIRNKVIPLFLSKYPKEKENEEDKLKKEIADIIKNINEAKTLEELSDIIINQLVNTIHSKNPLIEAAIETKNIEFEESQESSNEEEFYNQLEIIYKDSNPLLEFEAKTDTVNSTTGLETLTPDTNVKDDDPAKIRYYKALEILRRLKKTSYDTVQLIPGRTGVFLKLINPSDLFTESIDGKLQLNELAHQTLEKNTIKNIEDPSSEKERYHLTPTSGTDRKSFMESSMIIIVDNKGEPYLFNNEGEVVTDGKITFANTRNVQLNTKTGEYYVENAKGENQLISIEEQVIKDIKAAGKTKKGGVIINYEEQVEKVTKQRQKEFKNLYDIQQKLRTETKLSLILPITTITGGQVKSDYNNPQPISNIDIDSFRLTVVTNKSEAIGKGLLLGGVYFNLPELQEEILVVRPLVSNEIAEVIDQLLFNDKNPLNADETLAYLMTLIYTKSKDIWFIKDEETGKIVAEQFIDGKKIKITEDAPIREAFRGWLTNSKKLNISKDLINNSFDLISYDKANDTFNRVKTNYNDFIKNNFLSYLNIPVGEKPIPLNAYIKYKLPSLPNIEVENRDILSTEETPNSSENKENKTAQTTNVSNKKEGDVSIPVSEVKLTGEKVRDKLQEIEKQPIKINITQDSDGKMEQTSQEVIENIKSELDKTGLPYSDVISNEKGSAYFVVTKDGQQFEVLKTLAIGGQLIPSVLAKAKWINHIAKTEKEQVYKAVESLLSKQAQLIEQNTNVSKLDSNEQQSNENNTTTEAVSNPIQKDAGEQEGQEDKQKIDPKISAIDELYKLKTIDNKATPEQQFAAEQWWAKSGLNKYIPLERLMNVVNSNAIAQWTTDGITLFSGANSTDIYHEAWHGFSQLFLTKEQKQNLYEEVRKFNKNITDHAAEEILAEDFRKYVLSGASKILDKRVERNTIFRKIWNFLRSLFTNVSYADLALQTESSNKIRDMYEKLRTNNFSEYSPSVYNVQFGKLNKGIEGNDGTVLSNAESTMISNSIDYFLRSELRAASARNIVAGKPANNISAIFNNKPLIRALFNKIKDEFIAISEDGNEYQKTLAKYVVDNYKETIEYHSRKSEYLKAAGVISNLFDSDGNLVESAEEGDDSLDTLTNDSAYSQPGNAKSVEELSTPEIKFLIASLSDRTMSGNHYHNELGIPTLVNYKRTFSRILKALQGELDPVNMYRILLQKQKDYPEFQDLITELGDPSDYGKDDAKYNLWGKFRQDFSKYRLPLFETYLEKDEEGNIAVKVTEARPDIIAVEQKFNANFQSMVNSPYISVNDNGQNVLNIKKLLEDVADVIIEGDKTFTILKENKRIDFLRALGMEFANKEEIIDGINSFDKIHYLVDKLISIDEQGEEITNPIKQLKNDTKDVKGKIVSSGEYSNVKPLLILEGKYSDDYSNYSVINPKGDREYEHSVHNSMSQMLSVMNDAVQYPTYESIIALPEFASRLDITKNPLITNSLILNSLFDIRINKKENSDGTFTTNVTGLRRLNSDGTHVTGSLVNISGVKIQDADKDIATASEGIKTSGLDRQGKFLLDFNGLFQAGIAETLRHAEKSSYYGFRLSNIDGSTLTGFKGLYFPVINFANSILSGEDVSNRVTDYLKGALLGELTRIGWLNTGVGSNIQGYNEKAKTFSIFDGVLSEGVKKELLKLVENGVSENLEAEMNQFSDIIKSDFKTYFNNVEKENWTMLQKNPVIGDEIYNKLRSYLKDKQHPNISITDKQRILNRMYTYNAWIAHLEEIKFFYGDPAFYKEDMLTRIAGAGGTKSTMDLSQGSINYVNSKGRLVAAHMGIEEKNFDGTFGTRIMQDVEIVSDYYNKLHDLFTEVYTKRYKDNDNINVTELVNETLKPFTEMNEADAQGGILLDSWVVMKRLQGQWDKSRDVIYEKAAKGEELSSEELVSFIEVMKMQYFGPLQTDKLYVPAYHKFSLMPLIPSVIKGTKWESIAEDMMKNKVDYITFKSASKAATIGESQPFYENGDNTKRIPNLQGNTDNKSFTTNNIFARYLGEQLAIAPKWKKEVIYSTQLRKLIDSGLYENNIPRDYVGGKEEWNKLPSIEKLKISPFHQIARRYVNNIDALSAFKKEKLMKDANIKFDNGNYTVENFEPLIKLIKQEFINRDMPDSVIDFIDLTKDNKIKTQLDISTQSQRIEGVIQSIINNRLIRQKVNGESLIQVAGTGYESTFRKANSEEQKQGNDLPFYEYQGRIRKDGSKVTSAMKVKVALTGDYLNLLNLEHIDKKLINTGSITESRERLNECLKNNEWLDKDNNRDMITLTGVRIPVQGLNSMEFMEVYEFIPGEAGNVIILPSEVVAKSGSDYDVDKMTIQKANFFSKVIFNYTNKDLRTLQKEYPELDFSINNIQIIRDIQKNKEEIYQLDENDQKIYNILFDKFSSKIVEYNDKGEKGVENNLMQSQREILEMEHNFIDFVAPNTVKDTKPLADSLFSRNKIYDPLLNRLTLEKDNKQSPTRFLETSYNLQQFEAGNESKEGLGIIAVDNTMNRLFTTFGAYLNKTYSIRKNDLGIPIPKIVRIFLKHNETKDKNISLSNIYDANGQHKIADIISQLINGAVDVKKGAWLFNMNGGKKVMPIILLLNNAGVPIKDIANFVTQPIILEYSEKLRSKNNLFAKIKDPEDYESFKKNIRLSLMGLTLNTAFSGVGDMNKSINKIIKEVGENKITKLFELQNLRKINMTSKAQAILLAHYFELEDMADGITSIKTSLNFDTNKAANAIDSQRKINQFDDAIEMGLIPTDILLNIKHNSVINSFAVQPFSIALQEQLLPLRNHPILNAFILKHQEDLPMATRNLLFDKFARTIKNDLIQYLFQNTIFKDVVDNEGNIIRKGFNTQSMFFGENTVVKEFYKIKQDYPELVRNYELLRVLIGDAEKQREDKKGNLLPQRQNIRLINPDLDTNSINIFQEEFNKLMDISVQKVENKEQNEYLTNFFNKLAIFGFLQTGLNKSFISITDVIPQSFQTKIIKEAVIKATKALTQFEDDALVKFYGRFRKENTATFKFKTKISERESIPLIITNFSPHRFKDYDLRDKIDIKEKVISKTQNDIVKSIEKNLTVNNSSKLFIVDASIERNQEILTNFATKHKMTEEKALDYINEALEKNKEATIQKLKDCY